MRRGERAERLANVPHPVQRRVVDEAGIGESELEAHALEGSRVGQVLARVQVVDGVDQPARPFEVRNGGRFAVADVLVHNRLQTIDGLSETVQSP